MIASAFDPVLAGASPRPLGAPSLQGSEGGRRSFASQLSGALQRSKGAPSPQGIGGGLRLQTAKGRAAAVKLDEFASFFVEKMLAAMHKTTFQDGQGFPHGGRGQQVFQGWMDQENAGKLAESLAFRKHYDKALEKYDRQVLAALSKASSAASRSAGYGTIEESGGTAP